MNKSGLFNDSYRLCLKWFECYFIDIFLNKLSFTLTIPMLTVLGQFALEFEVSETINRSTNVKIVSCSNWFIRLRPQNFNCSAHQMETNRKHLFRVNIFVAFWCPAELFFVCSLYELFDWIVCVCATQLENFNRKRERERKKWLNRFSCFTHYLVYMLQPN